MKRAILSVVAVSLVLTLGLPVLAGIDWCGGGTPPGLGVKDDQTFPAYVRVQTKAGFSLHDVNPFSGNTAKTSAALDRNPVDPQALPADVTLGPR